MRRANRRRTLLLGYGFGCRRRQCEGATHRCRRASCGLRGGQLGQRAGAHAHRGHLSHAAVECNQHGGHDGGDPARSSGARTAVCAVPLGGAPPQGPHAAALDGDQLPRQQLQPARCPVARHFPVLTRRAVSPRRPRPCQALCRMAANIGWVIPHRRVCWLVERHNVLRDGRSQPPAQCQGAGHRLSGRLVDSRLEGRAASLLDDRAPRRRSAPAASIASATRSYAAA